MSKTLWIWNHYASDMYRNRGGRHYWFAKQLIKRGFRVTIFCSNTFHNSEDIIPIEAKEIFSTDEIDNITFVFVRTSPFKGNGLDRIKNMYEFYKNVKKVAENLIEEQGKPDYILASSVHPLTMLAGVQIGRKYSIHCISEVRDLWPEAIFQFGYAREKSIIGKVLTAVEKYIYIKSDAIIFTKPGDQDYILEKKWDINQGGKIDLNKIFYINNGIDLKNFNKQKTNNTLDDRDLINGKFIVVYTGTIKPVNNIDLILETAKILSKYKDIIFLIYGSGSEEKRIQARIEAEKIMNVKLKGRIEKKYIPYILSYSSLNLLNYSAKQYNWKRGNSSNKLFEYLASGKPIVSTVKMGYSPIVQFKCGIELDSDTAEDLSEAILKIKHSPKDIYDSMGINGLKAIENYDFEILTNKLLEVINFVATKSEPI